MDRKTKEIEKKNIKNMNKMIIDIIRNEERNTKKKNKSNLLQITS